MYSLVRHRIASTAQVLDFSFCVAPLGSPIWADVNDSFEFALAAVMFLLVAAKFIRHSYHMYKMTKQQQFSRYVSLLAREGMLYFLAYVHILSFLFQLITSNRTLHSCLPAM